MKRPIVNLADAPVHQGQHDKNSVGYWDGEEGDRVLEIVARRNASD